jgi:hypothetical protein
MAPGAARNTSSIVHFKPGLSTNMSMKFGREAGSEMEVSEPRSNGVERKHFALRSFPYGWSKQHHRLSYLSEFQQG